MTWFKKNRHDSSLLLLPEYYSDWGEFNTYSDLLLFEADLAYLTSAIIVFLESPGAIAELGAFSQISSLSEKLLVVVSEQYHPRKSFISLGPIRSLHDTKKYQHCLCVIPDGVPIDLEQHIEVIVDTLELKIRANNKNRSFN